MGSSVTLAAYAKGWRQSRSDIRPTTRGHYAYLLESHVLPTLGRYEMLADTTWDHFGLSRVGPLREAGYEVVGTDIKEDGVLIPHSRRHAHVVVCSCPKGLEVYDDLSREDRRSLREQLLPAYDATLRRFDPGRSPTGR